MPAGKTGVELKLIASNPAARLVNTPDAGVVCPIGVESIVLLVIAVPVIVPPLIAAPTIVPPFHVPPFTTVLLKTFPGTSSTLHSNWPLAQFVPP